ncbi:MFS transporter [Nonomuraea sp. NPDC049695]|uniref:MFS transporter n=1 Tax=Nonomuraea sp. NPDC049695 TaxID=3154734 RepID=UPI003434AF4E
MTATPRAAGGPFSWRLVTPLFIGSAINAVNTSLIATALVPIADAVHVSVGRTAVLVSALYLASAIAQPVGGKLAEEFGARRVFLSGLAVVMVGGVLGGTCQDLTALVVARVLIGTGSSAVYPSAMLLIRRRARTAGLSAPPGGVLGGLMIAGAATSALGLPLGGVLIGVWGWRAAFLVNLPVALLAWVMGRLWIPADPPAARGRGSLRELDVVGIAGFGLAMTALLVFLMGLPRPDWNALGLAVALSTWLVVWELRVPSPFIDVRLLRTNRSLTRTYVRFATASLCVYTVLYGLTQWLQAGRGLSAEKAGLLLLPMTVTSALLAQPIARRNLVRGPLLAAAVSCLAASAGVLALTGGTPIGWIVAITLVFGVTLGATVSANQTVLYVQAPADQAGTAAGLLRTSGYLGSIASSALISIVFHTRVDDERLHSLAWPMIAVSVLAVIVVITDRAVMSTSRIQG